MDSSKRTLAYFTWSMVVLSFLLMGCLGPLDSWLGIESYEEEQARKAQEQLTAEPTDYSDSDEDDADGEVLEYNTGEPVLLWKAGNDGGIEGGGGTPPAVTQDQDYYVTEIATYHSGYGTDAPDPSGTISLKAEDGTVYGPWETTVRNAAYWIAVPNEVIPAGTYTLIDSDPGTWAQNSASGGTGMGWAYGVVPE